MIDGLKPYQSTQDSGIAWVGHFPAHWKTEKGKWLFQKMERPVEARDDVVTCFRDGTVTLRKNRRVRGFTESIKEIGYQGVRRGDLVIHAMDAFAGAVGVSDSDGKCSPVYAICQARSEANSYYYAYLVREMARSLWILAQARGIRERSTDFRYSDFGEQLLPLPTKDEQAAIVRFLHHAELRIRRYIRAKQRLIKLLEEEKQAIIHHAVTRGLDFNVSLKPSGVEWLGDVPEHWEVKKLKRLGEVRIGLTYSPSEISGDEGTLVLRASNVRNGCIVSADNVFVSKKVPKSLLVVEGDILICVRSGSRSLVGKSAKITSQFSGSTYGAFMSLLRSCDNAFIYWVLNSNLFPSVMAQFETSTINQLTQSDLRNLPIPVPPTAEQAKIVAYLASATGEIDTTIASALREISLLREYRTCLIADVVTGKLDVRDATAYLPEEKPEPEALDENDDVQDDDETAETVELETEDVA